MARHKTTAQINAEREAQLSSKAAGQAREVLWGLMGLKRELQNIHTKEARAVKTDIDERITWLIAENETYRDIAAEMWRQQQAGGDIDGGAGMAVELDRRG